MRFTAYSRILIFAIACHSYLLSCGGQSSPLTVTSLDQAQLDKSASDVAKRLQKAYIFSHSGVVVVDFANLNDKHVSRLGVALADQFSDALQSYASKFAIIPRSTLRDFLHSHMLEGEETRNQEVAKWLADHLQIVGVIQGTIELLSDGQVKLTLRVVGPGPLQFIEARLPAQTEFPDLFNQVVPAFAPETEDIPEEPGIYKEGDPGVVMPEHACISCPNPDYTDLARKAKYQGSVKLSAVVGTEGKLSAVRVIKFAPFDLTDQAINALRTWRMKPYEKDGNPVPVRVSIDMTFQLL